MELYNLLELHKCPKNPTHTAIQSVFNDHQLANCDTDYCLSDEAEVDFMKLYKNLIIDESLNFHIHEHYRDSGIGPLVIDMDYKNTKRSKAHVLEIVQQCNEAFVKLFGVPSQHLTAYVCEKDRFRKTGDSNFTDGVHVYYPDVVMALKQRYYILDWAVERCCKSVQKSIFDFRPLKNGIVLYKSTKRLWSPGYTLTFSVDAERTERPMGDELSDAEIVDLLSIRNLSGKFSLPSSKKIDQKLLDSVFRKYNPVKG